MERQVYLRTVVLFGAKQQYNYFFVIYNHNEYCILQIISQNDSDNDTETETCLTDAMPPPFFLDRRDRKKMVFEWREERNFKNQQ